MKLTTLTLALLTASSLSANIDVRHSSGYNCNNGLKIFWGTEIEVDKKGYFPKFDELEGTAISDAIFFTGLKQQKSVQFFKDGFIYHNKIYKFKNEFSPKFFKVLSNNWAFATVCAFESDVVKNITQKDLNLVWSHTELDVNLQNVIEEWVYQVSLFEAIDGFDGSLRTSSYIHHFPSDLLNIESYNQAIDNIKKDTQKTVAIAHKMLQDDIKRTEIAKTRGELAVTNVHLHNLKLYENLKKLGGDNEN